MFRKSIVAAAGWLLLVVGASAAWSGTLLETSQLLAATPEAAAQQAPSYEFTLTAAGDYTVTLEDLRLPPALTSLQAIVTRDLQEIAKLEVEYSSDPNAQVLPARKTFSGAAGTYRMHVVGKVQPDQGGGSFMVRVAPAAGGADVLQSAGSIGGSGTPTPGTSSLHETFTTAAAGVYQLTLTDRNFPTPLASTQVKVFKQTSAGLVDVGTLPGSFSASAGDTFDLIVIASAAGTDQAGLYNVTVSGGPSSSVVYRGDIAVGQMPPAKAISIPAAGTYSLSLADMQFPESLTAMSAAVIQAGVFVGSSTGTTPGSVVLNQGPAQLFVYGAAQTTGSAAVTLQQGANVPYAEVHIFDASREVTTPAIFSFAPSRPVEAGSYVLSVADLMFPTRLTHIKTAVLQGTSVVHVATEASVDTVALSAGRVKVLVAATPPVPSGSIPGNGLFALTLTTQQGAPVFDSTQGVGGLFNAQVLEVPAAGRFDVSLKDFAFPKTLRTSWLAVTRGTTLVAQVIGSTAIQNLQLGAGTHVLNFLGQPAQDEEYGAYGLKVADSLPSPVVTFSASPTSITSGQTSTLQWSATNATACTATGAWNGAKTVSGSESTPALLANTTFEIECTGPGGRDSKSVTVTVNPRSPRRGGGGAVDSTLLICMITLLGMVATRRVSRSG